MKLYLGLTANSAPQHTRIFGELENSDETKETDDGQSFLLSDLDRNWWEIAYRP
jgi:hypothetical protein